MDTAFADPRLAITHRMDLLLRTHMGQGVDIMRTLTDTRYRHDLLLVCDAMKTTELPQLAREFRLLGKPSVTPRAGHAPAADMAWAADTSGFGASLPPDTDAAGAPMSARSPASRPHWYSPSRWLSAR